MICTFFGHRDTPDSVKTALQETLQYLIEDIGITKFLVGNNGNFDTIVYRTLVTLKQIYPHIDYQVVLAYLPKEKNHFSIYAPGETIFPSDLELVPPRYAISRRNRWMVQQSDYVVCYISRNYGGAAQFVEYAKRNNRKIILLSSTTQKNSSL